MSVRALSSIAVQRDSAKAGDGASATGGRDQSGLSSAGDALIHAIPSEVLAPYTALVGIIVSQVTPTDDRQGLRWWLFGVTLALVVLTLTVGFYRGRQDGGRVFPLLEVTTASIAFAAWGLAMPGSPLSLRVTGDDLTIATAIIAIGGAFVIGLLSPTLAKPSRKSPDHTPRSSSRGHSGAKHAANEHHKP
jgi:hypothetical protein